MGGLPQVSYAVGGDPAHIDEAAARIASVLRGNPLAADVRSSDLGMQPRLTVGVNGGKTRLLKLSPDDVAQTARIATGGAIATKARLDSGLVNVVVRGGPESVAAFSRLQVRSADGARVPLADATRIEPAVEPAIVEREDGERIVTVSANALDRGQPISPLSASVLRALRDPAFLPAGTRIEPRGDIRSNSRHRRPHAGRARPFGRGGLRDLGAALSELHLPLLIMLTVPLAMVGAFGSLFALNSLRGSFPNTPLLAAQTPEPLLDAGHGDARRSCGQEWHLAGGVCRARRALGRARGASCNTRRADAIPADPNDDASDDRRNVPARTGQHRRRRVPQGAGHRRGRRALGLAAIDPLRRSRRVRLAPRSRYSTVTYSYPRRLSWRQRDCCRNDALYEEHGARDDVARRSHDDGGAVGKKIRTCACVAFANVSLRCASN